MPNLVFATLVCAQGIDGERKYVASSLSKENKAILAHVVSNFDVRHEKSSSGLRLVI